jgi:hypothetical protein
MDACEHLKSIFNSVIESGISNFHTSAGWSKLDKVIEFNEPVNAQITDMLKSVELPLKYYSYQGSPHNKPDHGVVCNQCKISLSFPST